MTLMEEEARRRKALEIQEQIMRTVTRKRGQEPKGVTTAAGTVSSAAEGRGGRGGSSGTPKKIASSSAAARAPEAEAGTRAKASGDPTGDARGKGASPAGTSGRPEAAERKKPNKRENEFMMNLMILRNTLAQNAPACRERAQKAGKWVWRDIRLMLRLVSKTQDAMLQTMPESRDEYYSSYAAGGHYELKMNGPIRNPRHVLITDMHLAAICEAAMENECVMCIRDGSEIGKCPLREALLEVAPPTEVQESRWRHCEYRGAAGDLIHGRDVTI